MSCHLPKDMLALSVFLILFSQDIFGLESKAFPFDINPGPVLEPELRNYTRGKREICEATRGLFPMADKIRLRAAHNNYRRQMKIPGTNVRRLDWNIHLAQRAQAWADKCIYEHDYLFECSGERMGQNLFVSWGDTVSPS
ncbi:cysteine-rich secretory protein LCCL domain-containing 2-like [Liolophura sinensis]|uniref:cysteine-rich secretory protein LCCL domain-containing 2-like n=1 Tax=Liolophura sinensis TaxID=3198878 RepID=UPI0031585796